MKCISWESSVNHSEQFRTWFNIMVLTSYESKMLIIYICVIQSLWTWCDDQTDEENDCHLRITMTTMQIWCAKKEKQKDNRGILLSFKNNGCARSKCKSSIWECVFQLWTCQYIKKDNRLFSVYWTGRWWWWWWLVGQR